MKNILFLFILIISASSFSQTQSEINEEAYNNYKKADKELNTVYQKILIEYKSDIEFIKNLKTAQKNLDYFQRCRNACKIP